MEKKKRILQEYREKDLRQREAERLAEERERAEKERRREESEARVQQMRSKREEKLTAEEESWRAAREAERGLEAQEWANRPTQEMERKTSEQSDMQRCLFQHRQESFEPPAAGFPSSKDCWSALEAARSARQQDGGKEFAGRLDSCLGRLKGIGYPLSPRVQSNYLACEKELETAMLLARNIASRDEPPAKKTEPVQWLLCGGTRFKYDLNIIEKALGPGEEIQPGKFHFWKAPAGKKIDFLAVDARPVKLGDASYLPLLITGPKGLPEKGHLWISSEGNPVSGYGENLALIAYMNTFQEHWKDRAYFLKESTRHKGKAAKRREDHKRYAELSGQAQVLQLASNAMQAYLSADVAGGVMSSLSYINKMNRLHNPDKELKLLAVLDTPVEVADDLSALKDIRSQFETYKNLKGINEHLSRLKDATLLANARQMRDKLRTSLLENLRGLGWNLFNKLENTGEIGEQAAVFGMLYQELGGIEELLSGAYAGAADGMASAQSGREILFIPYLISRYYAKSEELLQLMREAYDKRSKTVSGAAYNAAASLRGGAVNWSKVGQAMDESRHGSEINIEIFAEQKTACELEASLAVQRVARIPR